jgi:LPS-assembly protein
MYSIYRFWFPCSPCLKTILKPSLCLFRIICERPGTLIGLFLLLFFISAHNVMAAEADLSKEPVTIEAVSIAYDKEEDTFHAKGDVVVSFSQGVLMADSVILNRKTNEAFAEGNVMVVSENDLLEGDKVKFDIETKTGVVYEGNMFLEKNHFYLKGSKIEKKGVATYRIEGAVATTCDGDSPDWRLMGRELNVTIDGYGTLKQGKFFVKDVPIFYIPYLLFPAKTTRQSGFLLPQLSYSERKFGWDMEIPFYLAISESTDATFYQRYMEKRGFKEGAEFRYILSNNSFGTFYGDFLDDTGRLNETAGGISRNWQSDQKRWSFYWNHETLFDPSFYFRTDITKVSDNWYFKDFTSNNYYLDNYLVKENQRFKKVSFVGNETLGSLDSTARLVKSWQQYNLTLMFQNTDDFASPSNNATLQKYPEIMLTGSKRPLLGSPLNFEFNTAYDYYYRSEGQKGHLYDLQPALSLPFSLGDYFQLTPQMSVKGTYWDRDDNIVTSQSKRGSRFSYNVGANLTTEIHKVFDVNNSRVDKVWHGIKPELTYTYIPNTNQTDIPDFAVSVTEQHTLTYSLTNTIVAKLKEKEEGKSYLEFMRFKISQTYDIKEAARTELPPVDKKPFSDIDMELDVKPFQYLSLSARNRYSLNSNDWKKANYDLNLSDWRGDLAIIGYRYASAALNEINPFGSITPFSPYRYTQSPLEEINLSLKAVVTKAIDMTYILKRNELDRNTLENTYGFNYHKQCWSIDVKISESANDRSYTVLFSLYGFGKVGR